MRKRYLTKGEAIRRFKLTHPEVLKIWDVAENRNMDISVEQNNRLTGSRSGRKVPKIEKTDVAVLSMELFNKPERGLNY